MASLFLVEEDEWELINDDGFVYKRKKRPRLDPSATSSAPPPDPAVEERNRRKRKKRALTKLKERYQSEIHHWELLSNTLRDVNIQTHNAEHRIDRVDINRQVAESPVKSPSFSRCNLLNELLAQLEVQEAMIGNISNLCKATETLCNVREDRAKQFFLDLPVWASSPRELMSSLCDD